MIFQFDPWKLDIDVEATRKLYSENDYALDREINMRFAEWYPAELKSLFESVGVDPLKLCAEEKIHEIPEDEENSGGRIYVRTMDFLMCGKILALPEFYRELYSDEEMFGGKLPDTLEWTVISEDGIPFYDAGGLGIVFKHPYFRDPDQYSEWDCGYIAGSILTMKDL